MRTKIILLCLLFMSAYSCKGPEYLPTADTLNVNQYGSNISLVLKTMPSEEGELIAVQDDSLVILNKRTHTCQVIPKKEVYGFRLTYASNYNYGWTIPLYTLASLSHGLFFIFTGPLNLIVTSIVTVSGKKAFSYSANNISYDEMKMFARFPQGIPPGIELDSIK